MRHARIVGWHRQMNRPRASLSDTAPIGEEVMCSGARGKGGVRAVGRGAPSGTLCAQDSNATEDTRISCWVELLLPLLCLPHHRALPPALRRWRPTKPWPRGKTGAQRRMPSTFAVISRTPPRHHTAPRTYQVIELGALALLAGVLLGLAQGWREQGGGMRGGEAAGEQKKTLKREGAHTRQRAAHDTKRRGPSPRPCPSSAIMSSAWGVSSGPESVACTGLLGFRGVNSDCASVFECWSGFRELKVCPGKTPRHGANTRVCKMTRVQPCVEQCKHKLGERWSERAKRSTHGR